MGVNSGELADQAGKLLGSDKNTKPPGIERSGGLAATYVTELCCYVDRARATFALRRLSSYLAMTVG